jgi:8-oxo-dGTP pyrophosphatase MutT (NUDIX family)
VAIRAASRIAGRVILLDRDDRILLIQELDGVGCRDTQWLTPGGGVESEETPLQAAERALVDETGFSVDLGGAAPVHVARRQWSLGGQWWDQTDHYFLVRLAESRPAVIVGAPTDLENSRTLGSRWWSMDELSATCELVFPSDLLRVLAQQLEIEPAVQRTAGRVLLRTEDCRVLLLEHLTDLGVGSTVWAAPGGGCEPGETPAEAACRELAEETGIRVELGAAARPVHIEARRWHWDGVAYDQTDHFFLDEVTGRPPVDGARRTELEGRTGMGHRWFSTADLAAARTAGHRYEPAALPVLIGGDR